MLREQQGRGGIHVRTLSEVHPLQGGEGPQQRWQLLGGAGGVPEIQLLYVGLHGPCKELHPLQEHQLGADGQDRVKIGKGQASAVEVHLPECRQIGKGRDQFRRVPDAGIAEGDGLRLRVEAEAADGHGVEDLHLGTAGGEVDGVRRSYRRLRQIQGHEAGEGGQHLFEQREVGDFRHGQSFVLHGQDLVSHRQGVGERQIRPLLSESQEAVVGGAAGGVQGSQLLKVGEQGPVVLREVGQRQLSAVAGEAAVRQRHGPEDGAVRRDRLADGLVPGGVHLLAGGDIQGLQHRISSQFRRFRQIVRGEAELVDGGRGRRRGRREEGLYEAGTIGHQQQGGARQKQQSEDDQQDPRPPLFEREEERQAQQSAQPQSGRQQPGDGGGSLRCEEGGGSLGGGLGRLGGQGRGRGRRRIGGGRRGRIGRLRRSRGHRCRRIRGHGRRRGRGGRLRRGRGQGVEDGGVDMLEGIVDLRRVQAHRGVGEAKVGHAVHALVGHRVAGGQLGLVALEGGRGDLYGRQAAVGVDGFGDGQVDGVLGIQMQVQLLDLPGAVQLRRTRVIGRVSRQGHGLLDRMGQELMLPVAVLAVEIVGKDHLGLILPEQGHQILDHVLLLEGVLILFPVPLRDVREGAQDGLVPKAHDPGPVAGFVLADTLPGGGVGDGPFPALVHPVEGHDGAHEQHVIVGVHGHDQIVQLLRHGSPGVIVGDGPLAVGIEGAENDLTVRENGDGPGPLLQEHGVVDIVGPDLLLEQSAGFVELLDAIGLGIVLEGQVHGLHRHVLPPGQGHPLPGLQHLRGEQLRVGDPPGIGRGLQVRGHLAAAGQVLGGRLRFDGIGAGVPFGRGGPQGNAREQQDQYEQKDDRRLLHSVFLSTR